MGTPPNLRIFGEIYLKKMSEILCLEFQLTREDGESFGIKISGGIDQDASLNPFVPGDSGIFITSIDPNGIATKAGLLIGDKILQVNSYDYTLVTLKQAERRISKRKEIKIKVTRDSLKEVQNTWIESNQL